MSGITVVDFTRHLPGLYCSIRLAEQGADVVRIHSYSGKELDAEGRAAERTFLCTGRQVGAGLNLRTEQGRELAFALAVQADVVVEDFRPGVMGHLGLDYDTVREAKPDIIYCSLSGYGQTGPFHQLGGFDLNYQAVSGFLSANRDSEGRPVVSELPIAGCAAGLYAVERICAALVKRERRGEGVYLDIHPVAVLKSWMQLLAIAPTFPGMRFFPSAGELVNCHVFESSDGRFVALAAMEEQYWSNFCHAVGRLDWEPSFGARIESHPDLYEELKGLFLTRTQAEWHELGMEVDCCLTAVEEPFATKSTGEGLLFKPPSALAADTAEVLRQRLSVHADQWERYVQEGIIPG